MRKTLTEGHLNLHARRLMRQAILDDPALHLTALAELTANALGHDDWLDDEGHWIWELALQVAEWASKLTSDEDQAAVTGRIKR